jgi:membrane carboxypeptidase/penicillin-binding protein PbpC
LIDPTLRREFQALPLKAVTTTGGDIEWTINGKAVGSSIAGSALDWPLMPGKHRLEARDSAGRIAHAEITVR